MRGVRQQIAAQSARMPRMSRIPKSFAPAKQLAAFISKFEPAIQRTLRSSRAALRKRFPTAIEQVYDNYNFLVIGYCSTERPSSCIVSLAASAKGVVLSFYNGASLSDPQKLLQGSGKQNRFIRLPSAKELSEPAVELLIEAAASNAKTPLSSVGRGRLVIKSISAKQRPRKPSRPKSS
jgi:hypothetical protein